VLCVSLTLPSARSHVQCAVPTHWRPRLLLKRSGDTQENGHSLRARKYFIARRRSTAHKCHPVVKVIIVVISLSSSAEDDIQSLACIHFQVMFVCFYVLTRLARMCDCEAEYSGIARTCDCEAEYSGIARTCDCEAEYSVVNSSRYSDWLRAGRNSSPGRVKNFNFSISPSSGVHPASYPIGTRGKAAVAWSWHLQLVPRSRKHESIRLFPHTSSWCSV
jgi:hypothetical protein